MLEVKAERPEVENSSDELNNRPDRVEERTGEFQVRPKDVIKKKDT